MRHAAELTLRGTGCLRARPAPRPKGRSRPLEAAPSGSSKVVPAFVASGLRAQPPPCWCRKGHGGAVATTRTLVLSSRDFKAAVARRVNYANRDDTATRSRPPASGPFSRVTEARVSSKE